MDISIPTWPYADQKEINVYLMFCNQLIGGEIAVST